MYSTVCSVFPKYCEEIVQHDRRPASVNSMCTFLIVMILVCVCTPNNGLGFKDDDRIAVPLRAAQREQDLFFATDSDQSKCPQKMGKKCPAARLGYRQNVSCGDLKKRREDREHDVRDYSKDHLTKSLVYQSDRKKRTGGDYSKDQLPKHSSARNARKLQKQTVRDYSKDQLTEVSSFREPQKQTVRDCSKDQLTADSGNQKPWQLQKKTGSDCLKDQPAAKVDCQDVRNPQKQTARECVKEQLTASIQNQQEQSAGNCTKNRPIESSNKELVGRTRSASTGLRDHYVVLHGRLVVNLSLAAVCQVSVMPLKVVHFMFVFQSSLEYLWKMFIARGPGQPPGFCQLGPETSGRAEVGHRHLIENHRWPAGYDGPRRYSAVPNFEDPSNASATVSKEGFPGGFASLTKELKDPAIIGRLREERKIVWRPEIKRKGASPREVIFTNDNPPGAHIKGTYCRDHYFSALSSEMFTEDRKYMLEEHEDMFVDGTMTAWALDAAKFDLEQLSQRKKPSEFTQADLWHLNSITNTIGEGRFQSLDDVVQMKQVRARNSLAKKEERVFQVHVGETEEVTIKVLENWIDAVNRYTGNISLFARCCPFVPFDVEKSTKLKVEGSEVEQAPALIMIGYHMGPVLYVWPALKKKDGKLQLDLDVEVAESLSDLFNKGMISTRIDTFRGAMVWLQPNIQEDTREIALTYPALSSNRFVETVALLTATCDVALRTTGNAALARLTAGVPVLSGIISVSDQWLLSDVWALLPHMWHYATLDLRPSQFMAHVVTAVNCFILVGSGEASVYGMVQYLQHLTLSLVGRFCSINRLPDLVDGHYDTVAYDGEYTKKKKSGTESGATRCFVKLIKKRIELVNNDEEVSYAGYKRRYNTCCAVTYSAAVPKGLLLPSTTTFKVSTPKKTARFTVRVGKWLEEVQKQLGSCEGHYPPENIVEAMRVASEKEEKFDLSAPVVVSKDDAATEPSSSSRKKEKGWLRDIKRKRFEEENEISGNGRDENESHHQEVDDLMDRFGPPDEAELEAAGYGRSNRVVLPPQAKKRPKSPERPSHLNDTRKPAGEPVDSSSRAVQVSKVKKKKRVRPVSDFLIKMAKRYKYMDEDGKYHLDRAKKEENSIIRHETLKLTARSVQDNNEGQELPVQIEKCVKIIRWVERQPSVAVVPPTPAVGRRVVERDPTPPPRQRSRRTPRRTPEREATRSPHHRSGQVSNPRKKQVKTRNALVGKNAHIIAVSNMSRSPVDDVWDSLKELYNINTSEGLRIP